MVFKKIVNNILKNKRKLYGNKVIKNLFDDNDKDGVKNIMDCKVNNAFKQGPMEPVVTLFYAGDIPPNQKIKENGYVYGFSQYVFAVEWARQRGYKYIWRFASSKWQMDKNQYMRKGGPTPYSDNEYICFNVIQQEFIG